MCDLIGGRVRDKVDFSAYPFYKHAGGRRGRGMMFVKMNMEKRYLRDLSGTSEKNDGKYGFGSIKFKAGVLDPEMEIETIKQLYRDLVPNVPLRIDPNSAWTVETSVKVGKALARELSGGGYLEDPTAGIGGMAAVRKQLVIRVSTLH